MGVAQTKTLTIAAYTSCNNKSLPNHSPGVTLPSPPPLLQTWRRSCGERTSRRRSVSECIMETFSRKSCVQSLNNHPNDGGVSTWSRRRAPSRKRYVVVNKGKPRKCSPPSSAQPSHLFFRLSLQITRPPLECLCSIPSFEGQNVSPEGLRWRNNVFIVCIICSGGRIVALLLTLPRTAC